MTTPNMVDIFQPNLYPTTKSSSSSSSKSTSGNFSRSGLPQQYQHSILQTAVPKMNSAVGNYEQNIDDATRAAQERYQSQTRGAVNNEMQGLFNNLASRNMLNSSVASDSISKALAALVGAGADKGFEAQMVNAGLKSQLPEMLKGIVQLGQESVGSGYGSTTQSSKSNSFQSNPLAPYELLAQYDWNMS